MTIQPIDLAGRPRPTREGYERNRDDVAAYVRNFGPVAIGSTLLTILETRVELRPTVKSATDFVSVLRSSLRGPGGQEYLRQALVSSVPADARELLKIGPVTATRVAAGDESVAFATTLTARGIRFRYVICAVRRGPVVETLSFLGAPRGALPQLTTARLARITAARIDAALR